MPCESRWKGAKPQKKSREHDEGSPEDLGMEKRNYLWVLEYEVNSGPSETLPETHGQHLAAWMKKQGVVSYLGSKSG